MAGRPSKSRHLDIWMNGQFVGQWTRDRLGEHSLAYDHAWVESVEGRPLSLSLPFHIDRQPHRGRAVANYFDNLLPDSDLTRKRLAQQYKAESTGVFDLLEQAGRDCVGAVQLLPQGQMPSDLESIDGRALSESAVARLLRHVQLPENGLSRGADAWPLQPEDKFDDCLRLSIAGAQEKTALLWHQGQWLIPRGSTPTTHIFKLPMGRVGADRRLDMSTSVQNEWLCLRILAAFGLRVPRAAMLQFENENVLVVERFDRELHESQCWWLRLPQEDFCQVSATPSHLKYESDGGPGIKLISTYLQSSQHAQRDLLDFFKVQVLFWMLAATDGHAKNFSIRLLRGGRYHLTPIYDVLSVWPLIGATAGKVARQKVKLAMAIQGKSRHYGLDWIGRRHFVGMAQRFGLDVDGDTLIDQIIEQTPQVVHAVAQDLPQDYPSQLFDVICGNLLNAAQRLAK